MAHLNQLVEQQVQRHLKVSEEEYEYLRHPSPDHLYDPLYYKDMRELVMHLHKFKQKQEKDPSLLLMVDGDYDTDGICAAAILTASLSIFGFQFRVHIPSMAEGYGLSKIAIDTMLEKNKDAGHIGMILTADNGISAYSGVDYAKSLGIDVLITDHHPGADKLPKAKAIVDPNQNNDLYPFKGNSGACVAWKAMLAYAELFDKEKKPLIERLIVFAGFSAVADVMPLRSENRYMVVAAIKIVKELLAARDYEAMADTPYTAYNTVFYGLYDLITLLQKQKDEERIKKGKSPIQLPMNEELFAWYLSPILNAPRRVHDSCLEGLSAFLVSDTKVRHYIISLLLDLNKEKSKMRDKVLKALKPDETPLIVCANTKKGISGLIAGKMTETTSLPVVVFSRYDPEDETVIYSMPPTDGRLSGSARSVENYPLHVIMDKINAICPGLISGGGHVTAAGFSIDARNYQTFQQLFYKTLKELEAELVEAEVELIPENRITLYALSSDSLIAETQVLNGNEITTERTEVDTKTFVSDAKATVAFLESLRPFGEGFLTETEIRLVFDKSVYGMDWNPDFWKTFKFSLYGVEVLTFDTNWADEVKKTLEDGGRVIAIGTLKLNEFRGKVTPQLVLSA